MCIRDRVLPELNGKLDGYAIRVPTINVSIVDLSFTAKRATSVEEVNAIMKAAAEGELKGILNYTTEPLVCLRYFGPEVNPDAPAMGAYKKAKKK
ncbi:MAG: hypothetical protein EBR62_09630, partial [Verrucomicrobia bacterium]|nr:hypothetical protein [Verrucomicrobiota bacterium]